MRMNKKGFTLMELLIVVVIIGILTSIALPMYKKAVERSRASDALTTLKAVAQSEHDWFLVKNNYTTDFANLDIDLAGEIENKKLKTTFYNYELLDSGIFAQRANGEYSLYRDYETSQIMCTPSTHYICDGLGASFPKAACQKSGMAWAESKSTCYATDEARCEALYPDDEFWNEDKEFCGYYKIRGTSTNRLNIKEGMVCKSGPGYYGCEYSNATSGGICIAEGPAACQYSNFDSSTCEADVGGGCQYSTFNNGSTCNGNIDIESGTCYNATLNSGSICNGDHERSCNDSIVNKDSVCIGNSNKACRKATINDGGTCKGVADFSGSIWYGACGESKINSGGLCVGIGNGSCFSSTVNSGGICEAKGGDVACALSTINEGGICKGTTSDGCVGVTVKSGGECWANAENTCGKSATSGWSSTYEGTGCCRGKYCPSNTPKCLCDVVDGKHLTSCTAHTQAYS